MQATERIGWRYQLLEQIGAGGMGAVFRADDLLTGEVVALKRMNTHVATADFNPDATHQQHLRLTLAHEFKTLASLRHPNIITVRDYGFDQTGSPYFTMDLLHNAQNLLQAGQGRQVRVQVNYLVQVLQALSYLHRRGILHRDLKPENVLVIGNRVKLLDFGLAVGTQADTSVEEFVVGTLAYMAPELLIEQAASQASDIYAVGMIAYELMSGHHPFNTEQAHKLVSQIMTENPDLSQIDAQPAVVQLIGQMLHRDPTQRLSDAGLALLELKYAVDQNITTETAAMRESFLQSARTIGRDTELTRLQASLDDVMHGGSAAWLLTGDSGVGKSRVLEEICIQAMVKGAVVLRGQAVSEAGGVYQIWQPILRWLNLLDTDEHPTLEMLLPSSEAVTLPPEKLRERLLLRVIESLREVQRPVVLLFEDLHWSGTDSLSLLHGLARHDGLPLLILASATQDRADALQSYLPRFQHMPVSPLSRQQVAQLSVELLGDVGKRPQLVEFLHRETEGNVFFLVEIVRALAEEAGNLQNIGQTTLPSQLLNGGLRYIIRRRMEQIPEHHQDLLYIAAAYGRVLNLTVLEAAATDLDMDTWLLNCSEATFIDVQNERWRFTHDRIRVGILESLDDDRRRQVHRQVAQALEAISDESSEHMLALAYHWRLADDPTREEHYAARAGELSQQIGAYTEAITFMERALKLVANHPDQTERIRRQVDYRRVLASAHLGLGAYQTAERLYRENLTQTELIEHQMGIATALANLGEVYIALEDNTQARTFFEESLDHYEQLDHIPGRIRVLNHLGNIAYDDNNPEVAKALFQQSLELSRQIGSGWGKAGAVTEAQTTTDRPDPQTYEPDRQTLLATLTEARQRGDNHQVAATLTRLAALEEAHGNLREATRLLKLGLASFQALGSTHGITDIYLQLGRLLQRLDQPGKAATCYRKAVKAAQAMDQIPLALHGIVGLAHVLAAQQHPDRAVALLAHILHNPLADNTIADTAERLLFDLEETLSSDVLTQSWEAGKTLSFEQTAALALKDDIP
jgi:eukaryotic-like serine/threonine-protein kinase